ncbi:beta-ketoacyl synthase N-terminal-like domain-containing protein [Streptomyces sp. NPDC018019]|uniref:beta-ketoacyl synthase N-terminal-like domain-containing protein n=1 Tax=Streptomyces sp. NPDC018019 TaxID=3365030 RepID=UPI0037B9EF47
MTATTSPTARALPVVPAVDIVQCAVLSAAGQGLEPLAAALSGRSAVPPADPAALPGAEPAGAPVQCPVEIRPVSGPQPAEILGRKGLRALTRADQLAMAACTLSLDALAEDGAALPADRTGVVLGSSVGSARAWGEFTRDTFVQEAPYFVNPSHFPGTLMNAAAGRTAIRHGLTGVNATVSGGPLAALHAFRYARNALLGGHAQRLLTGAVEELSAQNAWAWYRSGALKPGTPLGEGGAVFALQPAAPTGEAVRPLARLLACDTGFADPARGPLHAAQRLADCIRTALLRSRVASEDVAIVAPGAAGRRGWDAVEERALRSAFDGGPEPCRLTVQPVLGETNGAGGALQLAAVLARWQDPAADTEGERAALLTSLGADGSVGCAVVVRPDAG